VDRINLNATLTIEDWRALQAQAGRRLRRSETTGRRWLGIVWPAAVFAIATVLTFTLLRGVLSLDTNSVVVGAVVMFAAILMSSRIALRRMAPAPNGNFLGPCAFELDGAGLRSNRGASHSFAAWETVLDVTRTDTHVFVWIDRLSAYVLPCRGLPEGVTPDQLANWISAARARAPERAARPAQPSLAHTTVATAMAAPQRLGSGLLDLASLVVLWGRPALRGPTHGGMAVLVTLLALGTWVAFNRWENGPGAVFYIYGIQTLSWYLLGGLVVAWLLARGAVPHIAFARAVVVCALGAWLAVLHSRLGDLVPSQEIAGLLVAVGLLYTLAFFGQAARALTGEIQPRGVLSAFFASLVFFWSTDALYIYPTVWVPAEYQQQAEESVASYEAIEPLFFAQPERVDTALAAVQPSDPAAMELFFVGFAGYGQQKVFAEEIKFAASVVGARYGSDARNVLLLNDQRDLEAAPLASVSTLRYALRGIAEKMTLDDDVLFLALSSHGSGEWTLSVSNGLLPLAGVTPEELDSALDDAGIRWRVIVVSACYAGGFIDTLQDPTTIVLAAAAPDRTSFGCSDERDLTYFGEAFYRDALTPAASLRDAFATAERLVGEREIAEGVEPSRPVAFYGAEIERKLATLEDRFALARTPAAEQ
jgi:hypothetical protein